MVTERKYCNFEKEKTNLSVVLILFHSAALLNLNEGSYGDEPVGVQSEDEPRHEAHLTGRCQDVKVQVCHRAEWWPVKPKPAHKTHVNLAFLTILMCAVHHIIAVFSLIKTKQTKKSQNGFMDSVKWGRNRKCSWIFDCFVRLNK